MIVSTKGRYALRVMIDLAEHRSERYVPLKEVAERQEISEKYLENILKVLVQNGFLSGLRGKGGGYRLTRSPEEYTVGEILYLTEGSLAPVACLDPTSNNSICTRMSECRTYEMWKGLDKLIQDYFSHITLADLMAQGQAGNDYVI
jgi:Rrf2 family protein